MGPEAYPRKDLPVHECRFQNLLIFPLMTRARLLFLSPALLLCLAASAGAQTSSGREALLKAVQELRNHELSTPGLPPAFVAHYTEALDEIQGRVEGASSGQDLAKAGKAWALTKTDPPLLIRTDPPTLK